MAHSTPDAAGQPALHQPSLPALLPVGEARPATWLEWAAARLADAANSAAWQAFLEDRPMSWLATGSRW